MPNQYTSNKYKRKKGRVATHKTQINLQQVVGKGYNKFWNFKGRYLVCKGSRGSKKSTTTALMIIKRMMEYPGSNTLVVRKTYSTLKQSCYAQLKQAQSMLGVEHLWDNKKSPLEMEYIPTGQKIIFKGLDDPLKVTSTTVDKGYLCWFWGEEFYEVDNEDDFNRIDESIRGYVPPPLFKQLIITFNPWNEHHWLKKRFFDPPNDEDKLAITTNYMCNEFLDEADLRVFERMKENDPKRYLVAGLGNWGITDGVVYDDYEVRDFSVNHTLETHPGAYTIFGLDFGYSNDPTALVQLIIDKKEKTIYVYNELYRTGMTNWDIAEELKKRELEGDIIIADSSEPKSIAELKRLGIRKIRGAKKGKDSINNGIDKIRQFHIVIHPSCSNFIMEIGNYAWDKDKEGNSINKPIDRNNHLMDALRYAMEQVDKPKTFSFD